ncbi:MAG: KTSC domain-containing protein [Chloroflexi bacterium]|nr:KTSC domain-containing protein [Chloroflexota bacterium]
MKLVIVESSMIHAIGYDQKEHILKIVFNNGRSYCYEDVPLEEYKGLLKTESKGHYFLEHIRDVYACRLV